MKALLSYPVLASLQDATDIFDFSGGVARRLAQPPATGFDPFGITEGDFSRPYGTGARFGAIPGTEVPGYLHVVPKGTSRRLLVRCAHPDNAGTPVVAGLPRLGVSRMVEVAL